MHTRRAARLMTVNTLTSPDGTTIAYDTAGEGPALILVDGALTVHSSGSGELARLLAPHFTVYGFDRRGRGGSGDTLPYAVDREIDDIEALIDQADGPAFLYGHSSGGPLAMRAAIRLGGKVSKIAMYEPPYNNDPGVQESWSQYLRELSQTLAEGRRGDAVALFMRFVGTPAEQIDGMRRAPFWPGMEAVGPTLAYDHAAIMGEPWSVPAELAARVPVPALVLAGDASFAFMPDTARTLSQAFPDGQLRMLAGQTHNVDPGVLAPVLAEFFVHPWLERGFYPRADVRRAGRRDDGREPRKGGGHDEQPDGDASFGPRSAAGGGPAARRAGGRAAEDGGVRGADGAGLPGGDPR
jgi:pimeloyl-ACP methyl ester carboxylesterase